MTAPPATVSSPATESSRRVTDGRTASHESVARHVGVWRVFTDKPRDRGEAPHEVAASGSSPHLDESPDQRVQTIHNSVEECRFTVVRTGIHVSTGTDQPRGDRNVVRSEIEVIGASHEHERRFAIRVSRRDICACREQNVDNRSVATKRGNMKCSTPV